MLAVVVFVPSCPICVRPAFVLRSLSKYAFIGFESCCFSVSVGDPALLELEPVGDVGVRLMDCKQVCTDNNQASNWPSFLAFGNGCASG